MIQMFTPNYGFCLSADIKPSPGVHGTMLQEIDTGKTYLCIASGWLELTNIAVINITRLIQAVDHSIAITIVDPGLSQTDTITINGVACEFVSDATPTKQEISNGLIAAIAASAQAANVVVSQGAGPDYDVIIKTANALNPTIAVSANLTDTPSDGYARINGATGARLEAVILDANLTGTLTLADAGTVKAILPVGTLKGFPELKFYGATFSTRLEIKLSEAADLGCILWRAL
jgi:hypothetical protein